jgi:predicted regulator of Ras-like GTPase activity (Roadblock/LC7/MglB family)
VLDDTLAGLRDGIEGCRAAFLVSLDGMIVAGTGEGGREAWELIAASYADLARRTGRIHEEASLGAPVELIVGSSSGTELLRLLRSDYAVLVALGPRGSLGRARFELRKAAERLEEEL